MSTLLGNLVSKIKGETQKTNHVVVEIEITEHDYAAFNSDDEMLGESFVFNSDETPDFIRITVDGKEIDLNDVDIDGDYSDYQKFDMEQQWNNDDIVKFGYYDNIAGKVWEFDVENFDIEKLSFYYECFDVNFAPADYDCEEHRISLRYDGKEIEEDLNAYGCSDGDFEQQWYMYDDDDDGCGYEEEEDDENEEPQRNEREDTSNAFAVLAYFVATIDSDMTEAKLNAIMSVAKSFQLDMDIIKQRLIMEAKGERDYKGHSALAALVPEAIREHIFGGLSWVAIADFKISDKALEFFGGLSELWGIDEDKANNIINYNVEKLCAANPDREFGGEEEQSTDAESIFSDTDTLWSAVIEKLPEDIKANVSASAGKAYIHIKPKSKHLGVKDFKYCVEYSKTKSRAYVNVETLNGGIEGKSAIQNYIDSNSTDCIVKSVVPQQGAKNKDKWKWEVTTPATELNAELAQWYIDTITAFWNFFEE